MTEDTVTIDDDIAQRPEPTPPRSAVPRASTWTVWTLFLASLSVLALTVRGGAGWELSPLLRIDGLTAVMWVVVTFFSGIVHSYSRRYMAGDSDIDRFFARVLGFTVAS